MDDKPTISTIEVGLESKYSCLVCHKRKVKCDRGKPCSNCARHSVDCEYKAPPPRKRRKKENDADLSEKLRRYENLLRDKGVAIDDDGNILDEDGDHGSGHTTPLPPIKRRSAARAENSNVLGKKENNEAEDGTLVSDAKGKSRYFESSLWMTLNNFLPDQGARTLLQQDGVDGGASTEEESISSQPHNTHHIIFGGSKRPDPIDAFPKPEHMMLLWRNFVENVDPLIKMTHVPSIEKIVKLSCQNVYSLTRNNLALLFSIALCALGSMDDDEIREKLGTTPTSLFRKIRVATEACYARAGLMSTTDLNLLTSFVIYIHAIRNASDAQDVWTLVGVALRIAQRMGLHKSGNEGLSLFDTEIRRRVWKQILTLDWATSEIAGTIYISQLIPEWWTGSSPRNLNDSDLHPDMTELPPERKEPTDMIFTMLRIEFGNWFNGMKGPESQRPKLSPMGLEEYINEVEKDIEQKFLRFCDLINPLHVMVGVVSRAALCSMRIRSHYSARAQEREKTASKEHHAKLFQLSLNAMQYDNLIMQTPSLKRYQWHTRDFFQFHSLVYLLVAIRKDKVGQDVEDAWKQIEQTYRNRPQLTEPRKGIHVVVGLLAIQAWDAREQELKRLGLPVHVPNFIVKLRSIDRLPHKNKYPQGMANPTHSISFNQSKWMNTINSQPLHQQQHLHRQQQQQQQQQQQHQHHHNHNHQQQDPQQQQQQQQQHQFLQQSPSSILSSPHESSANNQYSMSWTQPSITQSILEQTSLTGLENNTAYWNEWEHLMSNPNFPLPMDSGMIPLFNSGLDGFFLPTN